MSDSSFAPSRLVLQTLGGFTLMLDGQPVADLVSRKAAALLVYLACARQPQPRDVLADLLWDGAMQEQALGNLRVVLNSLRRRLKPFLVIDRYSLAFKLDSAYEFDVHAFEDELTTARRSSTPDRFTQLERALLAYRGDFLAGFNVHDSRRFEEWALLERERLQRLALDALGELVDRAVETRQYRSGLEHAARLLQIDPLREDIHRQVMLLHARVGQRPAALAHYQTCANILRDELDVEPAPETTALYERIRAATAVHRADLPAYFTPFVPRAAELALITERVAQPHARLITLLGPGGSGKTRLALEAARTLQTEFLNGVLFVPLAAVTSATGLITAITAALGVTFSERSDLRAQLQAYLRDKELLLVLDNFDQLHAAADEVLNLLKAAPDAQVLITSRVRLNLQAEWLIEVGGLALPDAIDLFTRSAARALPDFTPDEQVVRLCQLVQGLPLAVELAAALVRELDCGALADQIARGLDVLATTQRDVPERQRSLRATFEQSWALLSDRERLRFAQLAVFHGGFTPEAAQQVAGVAAATLFKLADHSLVQRLPDGRLQLHELVRQFAAEKLQDSPELEALTRQRHAAYFAALLDRQVADLKSAGQDRALRLIEDHFANVRVMWEWAIRAVEVGNGAAAQVLQQSREGLLLFVWLRSWFHEGAVLFERAAQAVEHAADRHDLLLGELLVAQARCSEFTTSSAEKTIGLYQRGLEIFRACQVDHDEALSLLGLGYMAHTRGEFQEASRYFEASLKLYRQSGDRWGTANVLSNLCLSLRRQGAFNEAQQCGLESLSIRRVIGDRRGIASSQNNLGLVYCALGDYASADAALREALAICDEIGHTVGTANALTTLCQAAYLADDNAAAMRWQREALDLYREIGDLWGVAIAYNNLGQIMLERGEVAEAQTLFRESVQLYRQVGIKTGLANALSNMGQVCFLRSAGAKAAQYWREALTLARDAGEVPIGLEVLMRVAAWLEQRGESEAALKIVTFVLRQPMLLEENRRKIDEQYARLQTAFSVEDVAAITTQATASTFDGICAEALAALA